MNTKTEKVSLMGETLEIPMIQSKTRLEDLRDLRFINCLHALFTAKDCLTQGIETHIKIHPKSEMSFNSANFAIDDAIQTIEGIIARYDITD